MEKAGRKMFRLWCRCGLGAFLATLLTLGMYLIVQIPIAKTDMLIIYFGTFIALYEVARDIELLDGFGSF